MSAARPPVVLRFYPAWWRRRYGREFRLQFADVALSRRDRLDLARGAVDAWLHPPEPSRLPAVAALSGGALWTAVAIVLAQDPPVDWPGYSMEILPLAAVGVALLGLATVGAWLRLGDRTDRFERLALAGAIVGHVAWFAGLVLVGSGFDGAVVAAATSAAAAVATGLVALALMRRGDAAVAGLLALAPVSLAVSAQYGWLLFGLAWTAAGFVQWQRPAEIGRQRNGAAEAGPR